MNESIDTPPLVACRLNAKAHLSDLIKKIKH